MRCVDFDPQKLDSVQRSWWDAWLARATAATQAIVSKWEKSRALIDADFNSAIWSELKNWLLDNVFHGKCAYCEVDIRHARMFGGDAEHFRPKKSVKQLEKAAYVRPRVKLPGGGGEIVHPGYFWLAYSWENLMPTCKECNSGDGKGDKLPVLNSNLLLVSCNEDPGGHVSSNFKGYCYPQPEVLDAREVPQVCRPYWRISRQAEIDAHLRFGLAGLVVGLTPTGDLTIDTLKLNKHALVEARDAEQRKAERKYLVRKGEELEDNPDRAAVFAIARASLQKWIDGHAPFSSAVVQGMREQGYPGF